MLPAAGGPFDWRLTVTNETPVTQSLQLWAEITFEGKRTVGPVLGPKDITLQAGQSVSRDLRLNVATDSLIFAKEP